MGYNYRMWLEGTVYSRDDFRGASYVGLHVYRCANQGVLNKKFFTYPLMVWAILWVLSFILSDYHGKLFTGTMPSFTILGFHPSFAWTVITYWIGGVLTLTLGFVLYKDLWLSDEDWNNFIKKIGQIDGKKEVS